MLFNEALAKLRKSPNTWLITGVAGFIGSNILEVLLENNQIVVGLDNFSTGHKENLNEVKNSIGKDRWKNFSFIEGDITNPEHCMDSCKGIDHVLHQAALGSVPRSLADPITTNNSNISGFLNILVASKESKVKSFTYAASSSTYGDHPDLPKIEERIGRPLSPYAITKYVNELYAEIFYKSYNFSSIGLRYFNVFGKRQDPSGAYAAVIPKWIYGMINDDEIYINGDGETTRDFCFVENAIQANILAAVAPKSSQNQIYNVAFGGRTSLNKLAHEIKESLSEHQISTKSKIIHRDFRKGDVRHSQADISKAEKLLSYHPEYSLVNGIKKVVPWYIDKSFKE